MVEACEEDRDETLSKRLRSAALHRTRHESERVDDFVLDADGVIDLRRLDDPEDARSVASPPAALRATRGRLGDAGDVAGLYDDSEPEGGWLRRRRRRRRSATASGSVAPTAPDPTTGADNVTTDGSGPADPVPVRTARPVPPVTRLSSPWPALPAVADDDHIVATPPEPVATPEADADADIDLRDANRPTARCPKCGATGQRDLFDRVSQTSYFSCDACTHLGQASDQG